jgi:hypothetical protein
MVPLQLQVAVRISTSETCSVCIIRASLGLVSYFLSLLAEHRASFQRFLGLEVCIL